LASLRACLNEQRRELNLCASGSVQAGRLVQRLAAADEVAPGRESMGGAARHLAPARVAGRDAAVARCDLQLGGRPLVEGRRVGKGVR